MRKVIGSAFVSLDGVMQAPGGPEEDQTSGFELGGWVWPYFDETVDGMMEEILGASYDLLLGRKTYDIFASYWPGITDPNDPNIGIARAFNGATKYVASRGTPALPWANSVQLGPDLVRSLKALKAGDGPPLFIQGSSNLLQSLWGEDIIDEFTTLTFPVVLGKGKRLFEAGAAPGALKVVRSKTSPSGVVVATYAPDGAVKIAAHPG